MLAKRFEKQVMAHPTRVAVKEGEKSLTYEELNRFGNRIAYLIKEKLPGDYHTSRVGLLFEHGVQLIAAVLGVLKAGKVYVPLSVDYPLQRLSYMVSHSGLSLLVTESANMEYAKKITAENHIPILNIEEIENTVPCENQVCDIDPSQHLYILYTSGSTGKPKGVVQTHENVNYFIEQYAANLSITPGDHMTLLSSFTHDAAVMDIYGALLNGAALYPLDIKKQAAISTVSQWLKHEGITIWHSVPTLFRYFINTITPGEKFSKLRLLVLGGEEVLEHDIAMMQKLFPHCTFYNLYGQTEASYNAGLFIPPGTQSDEITIGDPVEGTKIFIVDEEGNETAPLEPGEIVVASPYISPGYWQNEQATRESFFEAPEYGRLYLTGDMGRQLMNGRIEFSGRKDFQVKIRGYRVELGEIENRLLHHNAVKEAVVLAQKNSGGETYLCAYIVANEEVPDSKLREFLAETLPAYMIPAYFSIIEKMPLTANRKVDRNALPEPQIHTGTGYIAPRNEMEMGIVGILTDILGIEAEKISVGAHLFDLGVNSITLLKIANRITTEFENNFPIGVLFNNPTIETIVQHMRQNFTPSRVKRLILLNKGKAAQNLFLLGPDGTVYGLKELARLLEDRFNVYGIQARGIMENCPLPQTIEELLEEYIAEIKIVQPEGPYLLGGQCFGVIFAYEIANILERRKNQVQCVIFFDEFALMLGWMMDYIIILKVYNQLKKLFRILTNPFKRISRTRNRSNKKESDSKKTYTLPEDLEERRKEVVENFKVLCNTMWNYTRIINAPMLVFKAFEPLLPDNPRWCPRVMSKMSKQTVEIIETPGNHVTLIKSPHVSTLAKLMLEKV